MAEGQSSSGEQVGVNVIESLVSEGQSSSGGHQVGVIESLVIEMEERLRSPMEEEPVPSGGDLLISCVCSGQMRPMVPIGPFHWLPLPSHTTNDYVVEKKDALHRLLPRDKQGREALLCDLLEAMGVMEAAVRSCYDCFFSRMTADEFRYMLVMDGCFLHSRFVTTPTAMMPAVDVDIRVDRDIIFLVENQLPFLVLEKIHLIVNPEVDCVESVLGRIEKLLQINEYSAVKLPRPFNNPPARHLLHLFYMHLWPTNRHHGFADINETGVPVGQVNWSAATYYYAAGVRFSPRNVRKGEASSILDVKLSGSSLYIPRLVIDNNTFPMLRNMVALEQQKQLGSSHVTAYCFFMSQLASTEQDVELLVAKKIIVHLLSNAEEVAMGLAMLCDGVHIDPYDPHQNFLQPEQEALHKLCGNSWKKSMAWLRHSKCNNYFMALAVVATILILLLTLEQSMFAALSYFKRGRN